MPGSPDQKSGRSGAIIGGLLGGLLHAALAVALWNYFGLDDLAELVAVKPLYGFYVLLGMLALGFVPVAAYLARGTISPAIVVGVALTLAVFGSLAAGPVSAPSGGPAPFGLYILSWIGVGALAWLAGRFENSGMRGSRE